MGKTFSKYAGNENDDSNKQNNATAAARNSSAHKKPPEDEADRAQQDNVIITKAVFLRLKKILKDEAIDIILKPQHIKTKICAPTEKESGNDNTTKPLGTGPKADTDVPKQIANEETGDCRNCNPPQVCASDDKQTKNDHVTPTSETSEAKTDVQEQIVSTVNNGVLKENQQKSKEETDDGKNFDEQTITKKSETASEAGTDVPEQISITIEAFQNIQEVFKEISASIAITIQIFNLYKGDTIEKIEKELEAALSSQCNAKIRFINRRQQTLIEISQILIILSIITSRVETDAENAIKDVKNPANTALVLVHLKEDHAMPKQKSISQLQGPAFKDLGGIFDLIFTMERGIYPCKMNKDTLQEICTFIVKST